MLFLPPVAWSFVVLPSSRSSTTSTRQELQQQQRPHPQQQRRTVLYADRDNGSTTPEMLVSDLDETMSDFFLTHHDWQPLFRSLCADSSVPAMSFFLAGSEQTKDDEVLDLTKATSTKAGPWNQLEAVPSDQEDKKVVADLLDGMQTTWLELMDNDDEMPFILEGRRLLAVSRFQVVMAGAASTSQSYNSNDDDAASANTSQASTQEDLLFATCWNELAELSRNDQVDTGSLVVLPPDFHNKDDDDALLQEFLATRIQQPLEWLGLDPHFEIRAIQRSSALRLLHKLSDPPTGNVGGEIIRV